MVNVTPVGNFVGHGLLTDDQVDDGRFLDWLTHEYFAGSAGPSTLAELDVARSVWRQRQSVPSSWMAL